jgi:HAD superfamily hydrolase (TIGR01490 family)
MPRAALFDMDRTLLRKETATLYVRWQYDIGEATLVDLARVSWWVLQYTFGVIDVEDVARRAVAPYAGTSERAMIDKCDRWFEERVKQHMTDAGRHAVRRHQAEGDVVAIVTGATPYSARPLGRMLGIEHVVSSELEVDEAGNFTGRPAEPLCYGKGKITRAERLAKRLGFELGDAIFYSDSYTDLPLLEHVAEPVVVNPDPRLRRVAEKRKWRIERW